MDDRQFDDLSRRIAELPLPRLPRRGLMTLLGSGALAAALGAIATDPQPAAAKKCKKEGQKCDKKKCKKQNKKCCCNNLKCKNDVCESKGGSCPTGQDFNKAWGDPGSGDSQFNVPWGISIDPDGDVFVTDRGNNRIQVFDANGVFQRKWGSSGTGKTQFVAVRGIAVNQNSNDDDREYVSDPGQSGSRQFRKFNESGGWLADLAPDTMDDPFGATRDSEGNIWVVDTAGIVFLFSSSGELIADWSPTGNGDISGAEGIAIFADKDADATFVYVARTDSSTVVKFEYVNNSNDGLEFIAKAGSFGTGSSQFKKPASVAADKCGNLWVSDTENNRIQKLDKNLNFKSSFTSSFNNPTGVALNASGNLLYVVDSLNSRVVKFDLS